jgi:hypothetical protein
MSGLVLVWDMDNTLVGNYFDVENRSEKDILYLNRKAVAVLQQALEARTRGNVDAIFMLTNNADKQFIEYVHDRLKTRLDVPVVFDYIMDRTHESRSPSDDPPKRLKDIEYMMEALELSTYNLANRVFFFDDIPDHKILAEIPPAHYIHIFPRFEPFTEDQTDFKPLLDAISARGGGRRRKQKHTRKTRAKKRSGNKRSGNKRSGKMSKKNLTNMLHDM